MRREALARWLNLTVIAAIIAVLTVVLVSTPTRVVRAADVCGQDGAPTVDPDMTIAWNGSTSGPPGTDTAVNVSWDAAPSEIELIVVWRPDEASSSAEVARQSFVSPTNPQAMDFLVPEAVEPGTYSVSVCWSGDGGATWNALDADLYLDFVVDPYDICQPDWEPHIGADFADLTVNPDSGEPGDLFSMTAQGGTDWPVDGAIWAQAIWDWVATSPPGNPATGIILDQGPHDGSSSINFSNLVVPTDAAPGEHEVTICYLYEFAEGGYFWSYALVPVEPSGHDPGIYTVLDSIPDYTQCPQDTDPDLSLDWDIGDDPHSGPAGTPEGAVANRLGGLDPVAHLLLWDYGSDDPFILASRTPDSPYQENLAFYFNVPFDATPGSHTIGVCYLVVTETGFQWIGGNNTITFIVTDELAMCGGQYPNYAFPEVLITLVPDSGLVGSTFTTNVDGSGQGSEPNYAFRDAYLVQVIWDFQPGEGEGPPTGTVLQQVVKPDNGSDLMSIPGSIVPNVAPGVYDVAVCFFIPTDLRIAGVGPAEVNVGDWVLTNLDQYTVLEPSTPTPTPVPPTRTPTPTQPPEEPPPPTATPTLIPSPTQTPLPTATATLMPATPTAAVVGTATIPAGSATGPNTPGGGGGVPNPNTGAQQTTTPGTSTPAATSTAAPTATRPPSTPTPTPTPTAAPTTPPSSDILGSRTEFVASVKGLQDISDDLDVVLTNVLLTGIFLILIFLTSEIFNQTIRDNQQDVETWLHNFFGPILGLWASLSAIMGVATLGNQKLKDLVWLAIVLVITVLIEGFLDPNFGFNKASLLLFISLLVAVGFVTYLTEGGEAFMARRFFGQDTAVRVFPAAIGIALVCVIMSRLGNFIPGILYGFVGTAVFLRPNTMNPDQEGKHIFFPMIMMLAISVGAWVLVEEFRGPNPSDFDIVMEGILIGVFIATIESVVINMLPIAYMDGRKLIDWNPLVWVATAGTALFLAWTVLLNDERAYFDSLQETTSQVAIFAVLFCFGLSIVTWLWFRYRPGGHA